MTDAIERARAKYALLSLDELERNYLAALDCLEVLKGPEFRCSRCNLGSNLWDEMHLMGHKVHPDLPEPVWLEPHAEAWEKFREAICGGK